MNTSLMIPSIKKTSVTMRKEENVLFHDVLNTFILQLNGIGHMVKDYSNSERENLLPPLHKLLFPIIRDLIYTQSHRQDSTHHGLCYTSCGAQ